MDTEYLVVLPVEDMSCGMVRSKGRHLPLHCTVMQWFRMNATRHDPVSRLNNELSMLASMTKDIELVSEAPDLFGVAANIPVHTLGRCDALNYLHTMLLVYLVQTGSSLMRLRWVGAGYRPHVTTCDGRAFLPSMRHVPTHLVLIKKDVNGNRTIINTHPLGTSSL